MRRLNGRYAGSDVPRVTGYIEPTAAGETITWGSWSERPTERATWPITLFPHASGSDYSGSTVDQSNYRTLADDAHVMRRSVLVEGGYSTFGIAFIGAPTRRIREICGALDAYPLLDESDHSELETEIEEREWQEWGRSDFKREIADAFDLDLDALDERLGKREDGSSVLDRVIDETWYAFASQHGDGGKTCEAPDSCHFYIDHAIQWLRKERDLGAWLVLGDVQWKEREMFSVARDAALEDRHDAAREILALWPDLVLVDLAGDEDGAEDVAAA